METDQLETISLSIMGKQWLMSHYDFETINKIQQLTNLPEIIVRIISERIHDPYEVDHFINPKIKNLLPDPFHLKDLDIAVTRVIEAINNHEKIVIFGDYDVDGATSSALLKQYFDNINVDSTVYIPDRLTEGYGPSIAGFQTFKDNSSKLVITLDCGTLAFDAINHATNIGLDVIVIDHHQSSSQLPSALAVVNPNRYDETSEYRYLAACGVSFLFLVALNSRLKEQNPELELPNLLNYLDLVALGTVCDVMPLIGLNRAFVKQGLKIIKSRSNIGLKALIDNATTNSSPNPYLLGFIIGPRINAGGRVGESSLGSRLLSTKSESEAQEIAKRLSDYNEERKQIESSVLEEATRLAEDSHHPVLVIAGHDWHQGVIGIIASRLKERFNKPSIIIAINGETGKGSSRSVNGFDLGAAVIKARELGMLTEGGGHAMAAGFVIKMDKIDEFQKYLNDIYHRNAEKIKNLNIAHYSGALLTSAINDEFLSHIEFLEPYGMGNEEPRFLLKNCYISRLNQFGSGHLSLSIDNSSGYYVRAKIFGAMTNKIGEELLAKPKSTFNFIGRIKRNDFYLTRKMEFLIDDILG